MKIEQIERSQPLKGRRFLLEHMRGKVLSPKQAMQAKCFECMNGFIDGREDCRIFDCPLHPYMPFSSRKPNKMIKEKDPKRVEAMKHAIRVRQARKLNGIVMENPPTP